MSLKVFAKGKTTTYKYSIEDNNIIVEFTGFRSNLTYIFNKGGSLENLSNYVPFININIRDNIFDSLSTRLFMIAKSIEENKLLSDTFAYNSDITNVYLPNTFTEIEDRAFYMCENLEKVQLPKMLTSIGSKAFYMCLNLSTVELPSTLTYIGNSCFMHSGITNINFSCNIKEIPYRCCYGCTQLKNICIRNVVAIKDEAFAFCSGLIAVTIPNSVIDIYARAFYFCSKLKNVYIHENTEAIGEYAFCYCNLKEIILPSTVWSLEKYAFAYNENLDKIIIDHKITDMEQSVFLNYK